VSPFGQVIYSIGVFKDHKHQTDAWFRLDHGKNFYATNTYPRKKGSVILVGWIKAKGNGPWAGCLSLPREAGLSDEGQLLLRPIPELEILRRKHRRFQRTLDSNVELTGSAPYFGECVEIKANYNLADAEAVGFTLIDDEGKYQIRYDFSTQTLTAIDEVAKLQFPEDSHQLDLHIFLDESIIEIFINGKETFTTVFYPKLDAYNSLKISPYFLKAKGTVEIDFWTLDEIGI
jgi:beta-fructofuranosidase